MGKIRKLKENELIGGIDNKDVYPITATVAVYNLENKDLETILKEIDSNTGIKEYDIYDSTKSYKIGDVVKYEDLMYRFIADKPVGEWNLSIVEPWSLKKDLTKTIQDTSSTLDQKIQENTNSINILKDTKQDKLIFDEFPTENSKNPVTSDGIYQALQDTTKQEITLDDLSPEILQLIINSGDKNITNFADGEDLTTVSENGIEVLKFKDRIPSFNSNIKMGYKILRLKDSSNILTQEDFDDNYPYIYEVRYDFDLNNSPIRLSNNSILYFTTGSLSNGYIENTQGGKYYILSNKNNILKNINLGSGLNNSYIPLKWFDLKLGEYVSKEDAEYNFQILNAYITNFRKVELPIGVVNIDVGDDYPITLLDDSIIRGEDKELSKLFCTGTCFSTNTFKDILFENLSIRFDSTVYSMSYNPKSVTFKNCIIEAYGTVDTLFLHTNGSDPSNNYDHFQTTTFKDCQLVFNSSKSNFTFINGRHNDKVIFDNITTIKNTLTGSTAVDICDYLIKKCTSVNILNSTIDCNLNHIYDDYDTVESNYSISHSDNSYYIGIKSSKIFRVLGYLISTKCIDDIEIKDSVITTKGYDQDRTNPSTNPHINFYGSYNRKVNLSKAAKGSIFNENAENNGGGTRPIVIKFWDANSSPKLYASDIEYYFDKDNNMIHNPYYEYNIGVLDIKNGNISSSMKSLLVPELLGAKTMVAENYAFNVQELDITVTSNVSVNIGNIIYIAKADSEHTRLNLDYTFKNPVRGLTNYSPTAVIYNNTEEIVYVTLNQTLIKLYPYLSATITNGKFLNPTKYNTYFTTSNDTEIRNYFYLNSGDEVIFANTSFQCIEANSGIFTHFSRKSLNSYVYRSIFSSNELHNERYFMYNDYVYVALGQGALAEDYSTVEYSTSENDTFYDGDVLIKCLGKAARIVTNDVNNLYLLGHYKKVGSNNILFAEELCYNTDSFHYTYDGIKSVRLSNTVAGSDLRRGLFEDRPISNEYDLYIGFMYFCTDKSTIEGNSNGIPIYYKGNVEGVDIWVDALGREIN